MKTQLTGENRARAELILSMFIFGTIGIVRRYIPLPSSVIALARGVIGMLFLLIFMALRGERVSAAAVKANLPGLLASGVLLGFNWILLFEAYRYTSVATATLCYYMAPIFIIIASPFLLKEKLTAGKLICIAVALAGMVLVSGVLQVGVSDAAELKGILLGLAAAVFYACIVLLNKRLRDISAYDRTVLQLGISAAVLLPYTLLTEDFAALEFAPLSAAMLTVAGVVHTGAAYAMYFGSIGSLKAQTAALFSYIDPIVAIILSSLLLDEELGIMGAAGAVLVLGATLVSELPGRRGQ